ncbi:MAG: hypothetical protein HN341_06850, partial [Verrucomicrobia bacterium]|nr:hypothetical protein [Verrucomicrobiota bacterium]
MKQWIVLAVAGVLMIGLLAGCRGKGSDDEGACGECASAPEMSALDELRIELADLKLESGRDAAIERMKALIADPEQVDFKPQVVEWLLDEYLREDPVEVVQDIYLELAEADEGVARIGFRRLLDASSTTNAEDVVAWHEKMLVATVSDDMKAYVWQLRARAYADAGSICPLADRLREICAFADPNRSYGVLSSIAKLGLGSKDHMGLAALCDAVKRAYSDREDLMRLVLTIEVDVLQQQGRLAEVEAFL